MSAGGESNVDIQNPLEVQYLEKLKEVTQTLELYYPRYQALAEKIGDFLDAQDPALRLLPGAPNPVFCEDKEEAFAIQEIHGRILKDMFDFNQDPVDNFDDLKLGLTRMQQGLEDIDQLDNTEEKLALLELFDERLVRIDNNYTDYLNSPLLNKYDLIPKD